MPKVNEAELKKRDSLIAQLDQDFSLWRPHFQELSQFILPRRYTWLAPNNLSSAFSATESSSGLAVASSQTAANQRNSRILDGTGTDASRTLAHGLMNGITSPARPWFRLRLQDFPETLEGYPLPYQVWLEEVARRMLIVLAESNFYSAMAIMYLELPVFGTAAMLIYEDFDEVIRCYNSPMGEFRLIQDHRRMVQGYARHFELTVQQTVQQFGIENVSPQTRNSYEQGGANLMRRIHIAHLIELNNPDDALALAPVFEYRELYWEAGIRTGDVLRMDGYREKPLVAPRWELIGNDTYGSSPGMDALADIKQLQLETKQKGQALDKMIRPPIVADVALSSNPTALLPGGVAFVPSSSTIGAKPIYTVSPPLGEMTQDMMQLQGRIRRFFYNNLFRNVSDLDTVRSAQEIIERKQEDMVILGAVLERFENEALDPVIRRVFKIMLRQGMLPEPPPGIDPDGLEIEYVSILADAQRAIGTASIERFLAAIGELAATVPEVLDIPNFDEMLRHYGEILNVPGKVLRSREEAAQVREQRAAQLEAQQAAQVGSDLTQATRNLAETEVGAGNTALDALLGG